MKLRRPLRKASPAWSPTVYSQPLLLAPQIGLYPTYFRSSSQVLLLLLGLAAASLDLCDPSALCSVIYRLSRGSIGYLSLPSPDHEYLSYFLLYACFSASRADSSFLYLCTQNYLLIYIDPSVPCFVVSFSSSLQSPFLH